MGLILKRERFRVRIIIKFDYLRRIYYDSIDVGYGIEVVGGVFYRKFFVRGYKFGGGFIKYF